MKITKAEIRTDEEGYNDMPERKKIEELLEQIKDGKRIVDIDKDYWQNTNDTLVFEIDCEELYRFGGKTIAETMQAINKFTYESKADEVETERKGAKIIYRYWWD